MAELTELIATIQAGDLAQVVALVEADGDLVNCKDDSGATPLHFAALGGERGIARALA